MQGRNVNTGKSRNSVNVVAGTASTTKNVKRARNKSAAAKRASSMHAVRAPKVVTIKNDNKSPFPWSAVIVCVLFTCMFLFMMMNYAEVNKYQNEIASLDNKITSMQKNYNELQVAHNSKYDLGEVGEYAKNHLGMQPGSQNVNREVITIEQKMKNLILHGLLQTNLLFKCTNMMNGVEKH